MGFSIAVIISLLLYHGALSSEGSSSRDKILSQTENLLEKFFAETKLFLDEANTRHVTVVGESDDQLRQTEPLLESFPVFIGSDVTIFCGSREFVSDTSIVYFLTSLDREYLAKVGKSLSHCKGNRVYLISEENTVRDNELDRILHNAYKKTARLPVFVHHTKKSLKFYGYSLAANCTAIVELIVDWKPRTDTKRLKDWLQNLSYKGCPLRVGTRHRPPWMNLAKDANGMVRIIGGSEGEMISTIAQKMNFTPLVKTYELPDKVRPRDKIVSSCAAGNISMGIAQIRPTLWISENLHMSDSYAQESALCVVPKLRRSKLNVLTFEFSWGSWLLMGLIFLVTLGVEKIVRSTRYLNRGNANNSGCCRIILDLIGSTIGNPIVYQPISIGSKLLLIMYLCYSTVMTTAYKSALSSALTVDQGESTVSELAAFFQANITPAGSISKLAILEDQTEDLDDVSKIIKRYVVEPNGTKVLERMSRDKDIGWLTSVYEFAYQLHVLKRAGVSVTFDLYQNCNLNHGNVVVFPKSSHLTETSNRVIQRLLEAGLMRHWEEINVPNYRYDQQYLIRSESDESTETPDNPADIHGLNWLKFYYIFYVYSLALIFCILVFLGELFFGKPKIAGRGKGLKNFKRLKTRRCVHSQSRRSR